MTGADSTGGPRRRRRRVLGALAGTALFLVKAGVLVAGAAGVAAFSAWSVIDREFAASDVVVPSIIGQPVGQAEATLRRAGLEIRVDGHRFHDAVPGTVFYQDPPAGGRTRKLRGVKVLVSRGANEIAVPDLRGQTPRGAALVLATASLAAGDVARVHSDAPANHVVAQSPAAGSLAAEGAAVDVLVSMGPRRRSLVMPDLRGADVRRAQGALAVAGVGTVEVRRDPLAAAPADVVAAQVPGPGTRIDRDTVVSLVVGVARGDDGGRR